MRPPDVIWIVTTQWRGRAGGWAGDPNVHTPVLDRLAREGAVFDHAITPHPFGPQARAALLTGMPSPDNGVRDYFDGLPAGGRTVAHAMRERGYRTAFIGKWHLGKRDPALPVVGEAAARAVVPESGRGGFDFWEGFDGGFLLNNPWLHGTRLPEPVQVTGYQSDVLVDRALDWMRQSGDGPGAAPPRFLIVSLEAPHPPYAAPLPPGISFPEATELKLAPNVPSGGEIEARVRRELSGYYGHIAATDRAIGRLRAAVSPDTLLVFTSVHGDMHGAHGLFRKGWPYEESVGIPLLVGRAGRAEPPPLPRDARNAVISLLDLGKLTCAWAEGRTPQSVGGDYRQISMPSVPPFAEQCPWTWRGVRSRQRKWIERGEGTPWLAFDLERDPWELDNRVEVEDWSAEREMTKSE